MHLTRTAKARKLGSGENDLQNSVKIYLATPQYSVTFIRAGKVGQLERAIYSTLTSKAFIIVNIGEAQSIIPGIHILATGRYVVS